MKLDPKNHHDYFIVTGLRGPDDESGGSDGAKDMTTAVLRWFVGISNEAGAIVYSPDLARAMWAVMEPEKQTEVRVFTRQNSHFRSHIYAAFRHLVKRLKQNKAPKATTKLAEDYYSFLYKENII